MLVHRLEQRLAVRPDDGQGWELIAPIYLRIRRADDAVAAQERAIRLSAAAARQVTLGEAQIAQTPGKIPAEAKAAFERAPRARCEFFSGTFYLGVAAAQGGDRDTARKYWMQIVETAGPQDIWRIPRTAPLAATRRRRAVTRKQRRLTLIAVAGVVLALATALTLSALRDLHRVLRKPE
jgi:cytochrome c-type biogenesis protein CcmH